MKKNSGIITRAAKSDDRSGMTEVARGALAPEWCFSNAVLERCLADAVVAERDGELAGVCALHGNSGSGAVNLVAVHPDHRRRGVGAAMVAAAVGELGRRGVIKITAAGGGTYLWPGIPRDLPGAEAFAQRCGWVIEAEVSDMTRTLPDFTMPSAVLTSMKTRGITFGMADQQERDHLASIALEHWYERWDEYFAVSDPNDIVVARDADGQIVAALIIGRPGTGEGWGPMLGDGACTIGCVGQSVRPEVAELGQRSLVWRPSCCVMPVAASATSVGRR